ncbi:purine nucleoside phosphorylase, partial [Kipferlia bialata]
DIPHMPETGVVGHKGELVAGTIGGKKILCFAGRFHSYEGYSGSIVSFIPRLAAACGCSIYMATNAAGGIMKGMKPGSVMILTDAVGFTRWSPLADVWNHPAANKGREHVSEDAAYSRRLADAVQAIANDQ